MKIVFGSVLYKQAMPYFNDFFSSVINQTYKDFDIILMIDDLLPQEISPFIEKYTNDNCNIKVKYSKKKCRPYELRIYLIEYAKVEGYDLLIIGDCDDVFGDNRIEKTVEHYQYHQETGFFYNQLYTFDHIPVMGELPYETEYIEQIGERNYLGLSNTAINMKYINDSVLSDLKQGNTYIFDWFLYSIFLMRGIKGQYVEEAMSLYRIHNDNLVGIPKPSKDNIQKELAIKIEHYKLLSKYDEYFEKLLIQYQELNIKDIKIQVNDKYYWWNFVRLN